MPDPRIFPIERTEDYAAGIGGISAIVIVANPHRVDIEIVNDLETVVYLSRSDPAVVGEGIKLVQNGSYSMDTQNLFEGAFYGICNAQEDGSITVSEGYRR